MTLRTRVIVYAALWITVISALHASLNVNWSAVLNEYQPLAKRTLMRLGLFRQVVPLIGSHTGHPGDKVERALPVGARALVDLLTHEGQEGRLDARTGSDDGTLEIETAEADDTETDARPRHASVTIVRRRADAYPTGDAGRPCQTAECPPPPGIFSGFAAD